MQISSYLSSAHHNSYQRSRNTKYSAEYPPNRTSQPDGLSKTLRSTSISSREERYSAWEAQRTNYLNFLNTDSAEDNSGAVSVAESEDKGEFLGITMIPEEGQSVTYGMRAMLSDRSTPDNPIVQVISNLGGENNIYNVDINKINPQNATQLEMFALLSYTDKMGLTDGGSFGSHQQLEVYGNNARLNGYCADLSGKDVFINEKFNWSVIIEKMMKDYLNAEIYNQYEDCKKLLDYFGTITTKDNGEKI